MVHSLFLEHCNHGNHTISDVNCHLFLEQTKRFFYIRVLLSVGAMLYYMLHAHPFMLPQIVPRIFHALSFASLCISQKIGRDSSIRRALITPTQLYRSHEHAVIFYFQCSTVSSASRLLFLRPQRITHRIFGIPRSRLPLRDATLLGRTCFFKVNKVFPDSVMIGCKFLF
jgi:hypothetical protein